MKRKTIFLVALFVTTFLTAQETTLSSANESTENTGSVTYSVGLLTVKTLEGADGSVSQGTQIPLEVTQLLSVNDPSFNDVSLQVYPNPTVNVIRLKSGKHTDLSYQLYDINGKLIRQQTKISSEQISLQHFKSGIYLLKVLQETKEIKTFKIIKK